MTENRVISGNWSRFTSIHISQESYEFIEGRKIQRLHEPRYRTLDRIIAEYEQQKITLKEQKTMIEELDFVIEDLRGALSRQTNKTLE